MKDRVAAAMQDLVNAQTSVNRAVFEGNKPGEIKPQKPDEKYVHECIAEAQASLAFAAKILLGIRSPRQKRQ